MPFQFHKHYSLEEARALLPQLRVWLDQINAQRRRMEHLDKRLGSVTAAGDDVGGESVNQWFRAMADCKEALLEFQRRHIFIKDIDRGLVDFPALRDGREVFLCWERDEDDIEHWHELDSGFAGREPI